MHWSSKAQCSLMAHCFKCAIACLHL